MLHQKRGLVGGAWEPAKGSESRVFLDLESETLDIKGVPRATSMLEFLVWDPCAFKKTPLSACSMPVLDSVGGVGSSEQSSWTMLEIIGKFMKASDGTICGLVFDAHGSHALVRRIIHGDFTDVPQDDLATIPWFEGLKHVPLPPNDLPRLPIQICLDGGKPVYALCGPCNGSCFEIFFFLI